MKFFSSFVRSLHSPHFYQSLYRDGTGIGLKYLVQLVVTCWFLVALVLTYVVFQANKNPESSALLMPTQILRKISPQFPIVTILNGKASLQGDQPLTLYDPETGLPLMLIDTTGKVNSLEKSEAIALLTRSTFKMRYGGEDVTYELPEGLDVTINSSKLEEWADLLERLMPYAPFIILPFNVIGSLISLALRWLMLGGIAFVALKSNLEEVKFVDALRLAAYAQTASIILKMAIIASGFQPFGSPELVLMGTALLYLFFAVSSVLRIKK
jgi:hypothetical protein